MARTSLALVCVSASKACTVCAYTRTRPLAAKAALTEHEAVPFRFRLSGVDIAGKPGDPVLAAAGGRVVYAGTGLRGYGKLVIVKHDNSFLSAYAHNQNLLVKEGQAVTKGQKIAELGDTDADAPKLHFEIRKSGKPVDPAKYLPVLAKTNGYKGVTGVISFDAKGDIKNGALTLYTFKAGKRDQIAVVR